MAHVYIDITQDHIRRAENLHCWTFNPALLALSEKLNKDVHLGYTENRVYFTTKEGAETSVKACEVVRTMHQMALEGRYFQMRPCTFDLQVDDSHLEANK